jgi:glutamine amidotransferase
MSEKLIAIPRIPLGNVASVARMVEKCGGRAVAVADPAELLGFEKIILAGVGAFDYGMSCLTEGGWVDVLNEAVLERRVPVLGICLGMQLMCLSSEEGRMAGLGWVQARVRRFPTDGQPADFKVPHMGWNTVRIQRMNPLFSESGETQRFYFVHSYHVVCDRADDVVAVATHGVDFTAALNHENVFGVQFHPEKSHRFGMALLGNFVALRC